MQTPGNIAKYVEGNNPRLGDVRKDLLTHEVVSAILIKNPTQITECDKSAIDVDIATKAVSYNADLILSIPVELINRDILLSALNKSPALAAKIPYAELALDLEAALVEVVCKVKYVFSQIPKDLRSQAITEAAVRFDPMCLRHVPLIERTADLCAMAYCINPDSQYAMPDDILAQILKKGSGQANSRRDGPTV